MGEKYPLTEAADLLRANSDSRGQASLKGKGWLCHFSGMNDNPCNEVKIKAVPQLVWEPEMSPISSIQEANLTFPQSQENG